MLNIRICSFSYKKSGIPKDETTNGGGFVFDCRFIYNPGREEQYKALTGKDAEVAEFLDSNKEMQEFLTDIFSLTGKAVDVYLERKFTNLMISFGCTGGQHRSVYAAEKLKSHLAGKYGNSVNIAINHMEYPGL